MERSERQLFSEADSFLLTLRTLLADDDAAARQHVRLLDTLDKYQEQPQLLDPHLQAIVGPVVSLIKRRHLRPNAVSGKDNGGEIWLRFEPPKELDETGALEYPHCWFRLLYRLTKVRGYKTVVKFFSHEVADLEPALELLMLQESGRARCVAWETRYILLLWISLIVMVPFDLRRVDSGSAVSQNSKPLVARIADLASSYLSATGKEREAAGILLARLLVRPDTVKTYLPEFLERAQVVISKETNAFTLAGYLHTICQLLAFGKREDLLPHLTTKLMPCLESLESGAAAKIVKSNSLVAKLSIKLTQRIALVGLRQRKITWLYQRGYRSLQNNLLNISSGASTNNIIASGLVSHREQPRDAVDEDEDPPEGIEEVIGKLIAGLSHKDTIVRWSAAKGIGRICLRLPSKELMNDVASSLVDTVMDPLSSTPDAWHGVCLALAELARRGCLGVEWLDRVVSLLQQALVYDVRVGTHSLGAHVRDAACYVAWSLARAYEPRDIRQHVTALACALMVVAVCDREVNCRRAAAAAYQEHVGRQGVFPHGIDVIATADYWSVGNRSHAYIQVAEKIAGFEEYRRAIMDHFAEAKTRHWDKNIRNLTALSLARLCPLDPDHFKVTLIPSLVKDVRSSEAVVRHGVIVALGKIALSLDRNGYVLDDATVEDLVCIASYLRNEEHLSGFGSDMMMEACLQAINDFCQCQKIDWHLSKQNSKSSADEIWLAVIEDGLERKLVSLQELAAQAFSNWCHRFGFVEEDNGQKDVAHHDRLSLFVKQYVSRLTAFQNKMGSAASTNPLLSSTSASASNNAREARRGYTAALGMFPFQRMRHAQLALETCDFLFQIAKVPAPKTINNDPEARRNALNAIIQILASWCSAPCQRQLAQIGPSMDTQGNSSNSGSDGGKSVETKEGIRRDNESQDHEEEGDDDIVDEWAGDSSDAATTTSGVLFPAAWLGKEEGNEAALAQHEADRQTLLCQAHPPWLNYLEQILSLYDDYTSDNRGDVGSWVREAAMIATARLLCMMQDCAEFLREPAGTMQGVSEQNEKETQKQSDLVLFNSLLVQATAAMLRQACEKIDRVRAIAASALRAVLRLGVEDVRFNMPHAERLRTIFLGKSVNWSAPADVFPLMTPLLVFREYRLQILQGLVISVGGLTESLVRHSMNNLKNFLQSLATKGANDDAPMTLSDFGVAVIALTKIIPSVGSDRIIMPLFSTLELLMESSVIMDGLRSTGFGHAIFLWTRKEINNSKDIKKIIAGIGVLCGLLSFGGETFTESLNLLIQMLLNKYPRVRKECAEKLYVVLFASEIDLATERRDADIDVIMTSLTETQWEIENMEDLSEPHKNLLQQLHFS